MRMHRRLRQTALIITAAVACAFSAARPAAAATPEQVNQAIEKAKKYILSEKKGDNWESVPAPKGQGQADPDGAQWGGTTACAVYGLLATGMNPKDPAVAPAIEWLKKAKMGGHYADGMRSQVWALLKDEREAKLAAKTDAAILLNAMHAEGADKGLYPYYTDLATGKPQDNWADHSVSQISVLGIWACEQAGIEIPTLYWQIVDAKWKADQQQDGGWNYQKGRGGSTATMTAAGVATLFITQDYLLQGNKWSNCDGGVRNENIERGLAWWDRHISETLNGGGGEHYYYAMYGIERIAVASGRKYFGTVDWYKVGADHLVRKQNGNGSFGAGEGHHNPKGIPDTVFATLFLVRGRAPIVMSKLEYQNDAGASEAKAAANATAAKGEHKDAPATAPAAPVARNGVKKQDDPWDERPRDSYNFAHWATREVEQYLNYQIINLRVPSEELHDSPIIYIAGSEALNLGDNDIRKLREFVEDGGMILGNSDCSSQAFTTSFIALGRKLFPKYEFAELRPNHTIFVDEQFKAAKWRFRPRVMGLSNGVRELMLIAPDLDMGKSWQTRSEKTKEESYQLMQDIFLYSVDKKNLRYRGDTYIITANPGIKAERSVNVARLEVGDNPDPEPGAWRRLGHVLHNEAKLDVKTDQIKPGDGKLDPKQFPLAHLTGTTKFTLTEAAQKELKDYVNGGGTLVVDAAGGATDFADAAEAQLPAVFGGAPGQVGQVLMPDDPLYTGPIKVHEFDYRMFAKAKLSGRLNVPRMRAIEVKGRKAVFYSREDLTAGLVGQQVDGIMGYAPDTATNMLRNIVMHAAGSKAAAVASKDADAPPAQAPPPPAKSSNRKSPKQNN